MVLVVSDIIFICKRSYVCSKDVQQEGLAYIISFAVLFQFHRSTFYCSNKFQGKADIVYRKLKIKTMAKTVLNSILEQSLRNMKRDIISNGGSMFCVIINDGEIIQSGGGNAEQMQHLLRESVAQIDRDKMIILNPHGKPN